MSGDTIPARPPTVLTDGGPWAMHDMPCPVLGAPHHAVLDLNTGVYHPSWAAQSMGWRLTQRRHGWWRRLRSHGRTL
jgi:hypothetical protein